MRHNLKAAAVSVLAIMAALAMSIPAYAADKKISEVKFRVNAKPEAGDRIRMYKLRRVMLRLPSRSLTMTTASGREVISRSST